ncbi:MAG: serine--tRNA ligase [Leptospiraceae bacterium]|nr:serine--tRNA ligase [Leptospiraceae bacterium]MDW8305836.1 serine--tRNA ligase [Leptospiraceae bacterium]
MLDLQLLRNEDTRGKILDLLRKRGVCEDDLELLVRTLELRSQLMFQLETLQRERNQGAKVLGEYKRQGREEEFHELKEKMEVVKKQIEGIHPQLLQLENKIEEIAHNLPNIFLPDVPVGKSEQDNVVVRVCGEKPNFSFQPKPHYEIAEQLGLIDFARGVKLSGSRFYVYNEEISALERKLINFMLEMHIEGGYRERTVPYLVNDSCMFGTGQFPKFKDEYYRIPQDGLNLIPTAEVPLTNLYANEIFSEEELPLYLTAATPCFRREAGAAGKDTRGLIRVHQFMKVELVKFCVPEQSRKEHELLLQDAEKILKHFQLYYRVVQLCSGDLGFASAQTYDLEIYMPASHRWLEISSVSNFLDFQARRAKIRFKRKHSGKNEYVHTLNASGVAAGRLIAALLEYYQTPEGQIDWGKLHHLLEKRYLRVP